MTWRDAAEFILLGNIAIKNPGNGEDAALMPYDVIVVPRSRIADIDLFVKHYIRDALPVEPYMSLVPF